MVYMEYSVVIMDETDFVGVMDGMAHSVEVLDRMDHEVEDIPGVLLQANLLPMPVPYHSVGMDAHRRLVRYNVC